MRIKVLFCMLLLCWYIALLAQEGGEPRLRHSFGMVFAGSHNTATVDLGSNIYSYTVTNIELQGSRAFSLSGLPELPFSYQANDPFPVQLHFDPPRAGTFSTQIKVSTDLPNLPFYLDLSGGTAFDPMITSLPYVERFNTDFANLLPAAWSKIVQTPVYNASVGLSSYDYWDYNCVLLYNGSQYDETAQIYLISPQINPELPAGDYRLSFRCLGSGSATPLIIGTLDDPSDPAGFIACDTLFVPSYWNQQTVNLPNWQGASRYLAFKHGLSGANRYIYMQDFTLEEIPQYDLAVVGLTGYYFQSRWEDILHFASVKNMGTASYEHYRIVIEDRYANPLGVSPGLPVAPGATVQVPIVWRSSDATINQVFARLERIPGGITDANPYNDRSPALGLRLGEMVNYLNLGIDQVQERIPISLYHNYSIFQTIIPAGEIGRTGWIDQLVFFPTFSSGVSQNRIIRIYVGETDRTDLQDGWIPSSLLTEVYNRSVTNISGNLHTFAFSQPYHYQGGNLVVMVAPLGAGGVHDYFDRFKCQRSGNLRTRFAFSANSGFDSNNPPLNSQLLDMFPIMSLHFDTAGPASGLQSFPEEKDFGTVVMPLAQTELFQIRNMGSQPIDLLSADIRGDESFSIEGYMAFPRVLAAGASLYLNIRYHPENSGTHSAELILTDSWGRSIHSLALRGRAINTQVSELPLDESFDNLGYLDLPSGWEAAVFTPTGACRMGTDQTLFRTAPASYKLSNQNVLSPLLKLSSPVFAPSVAINNLRFKCYARSTLPGLLKLGFCNDPSDPQDFEEYTALNLSNTWELYSVDFVSYNGTGRHLALRYEGGVFNNSIYIDDIRLEYVPELDLELVDLHYNTRVTLGQNYLIRSTIRNWGSTVQQYRIRLMNGSGSVLADRPGEVIGSGEELSLELLWLPDDYSSALRVEIDLAGDENQDNNWQNLSGLSFGEEEEVLSFGNGNRAAGIPLDFNARSSLYQMLVSREELYDFYGWIQSLYLFTEFNATVPATSLRIWMGTTDIENLNEGWIGVGEQTLVFDGSLPVISAGLRRIQIELNQDFDFRLGRNLVITFLRPLDSMSRGFYKYFRAQDAMPGRQRLLSLPETDIQPEYPLEGELAVQSPKLELGVRSGGVGEIRGQVQNSLGEALSGVRIEVVGQNRFVSTNAEGIYIWDHLPAGNWLLQFSMAGFIQAERLVTVVEGQTTTQNLSLTAYPVINVYGRLIGSDTSEGISGADIHLSGMQFYQTQSIADGSFVFTGILGAQVYDLRIQASGYQNRELNLSTLTADLNLGELVLSERANPPVRLEARKEDGAVVLNWLAPNEHEVGLMEDFEDFSGWTVISQSNSFPVAGGLYSGWRVVGEVNPAGGQIAPYQGQSQMGLGWAETHQDEWLISPLFNCPAEAVLSFWTCVYRGSSAGDHYYVKLSLDDGDTWVELWDASAQTGGWNLYQNRVEIDLSPYFGNLIRLAWHAADSPTNLGLWYYWLLDGISVDNYLPPSSRALEGYRIWRLPAGSETNEESWSLLADCSEGELSYRDEDWQQLPENSYRWAVMAIYNNDVLSGAVFSNVLAQDYPDGMISGVVRNTSNLPIAGACVSTGSYTATTNQAGAYSLILPVGTYELCASATGYQSQTSSGIVVLEGQSATVNFVLVQGSEMVEVPALPTALGACFPNPFSSQIRIEYSIEEPGELELEIFNIRGQRVRILEKAQRSAGIYHLYWNGLDSYGIRVGTGLYFLRMKAGDKFWQRKIIYQP